MPRVYTRRPLEERFWEKDDKNGPVPAHRPDLGPCWVWTGSTDRKGYGKIGRGGRCGRGPVTASRAAFFFVHGRWPDPFALHHCDNPPCCKAIADDHGPAHIFEGTAADNLRDMDEKGRRGRSGTPGELHHNAKVTEVTADACSRAPSASSSMHVKTIPVALQAAHGPSSSGRVGTSSRSAGRPSTGVSSAEVIGVSWAPGQVR